MLRYNTLAEYMFVFDSFILTMFCMHRNSHEEQYFLLCSSSIDVSKIEEDSLKQETEALKSQLETVEKLNDTLRYTVGTGI